MIKYLYAKDVSGNLRVWYISVVEDIIRISYGIFNGAIQHQEEQITSGKGGKTLAEQINSRYQSRINKQLLKGYKHTIEEALQATIPTNALLMPKPMLAQKGKPIPRKCFIQYKYDGNRCMIVKDDEKVFAYSRNGKPITTVPHILECAKDIPEGTILDGELYSHGMHLQSIRSAIACEQFSSKKLQFLCYDTVEKVPYGNRLAILKELPFGQDIVIVPTWEIDQEDDPEFIPRMFKQARSEGYEGLIARDKVTGYDVGKRSPSLLKIKQVESEEFLVIDIVPSKDNWAVLVCINEKQQTFKVSCPLGIEFKTLVLLNKDKYIGQWITVEYANLTPDGLPFHPVAIAFREAGE